MNHILGINRFQVTFSCLEDAIPSDNPVRIIDAFIDKLDLELLGFNSKPTDEEQTKKHNPYLDGRPSFEPKILLKLYFYGYFNSLPRPFGGIRSSRRLEKECLRNIEVRWLINGLAPN